MSQKQEEEEEKERENGESKRSRRRRRKYFVTHLQGLNEEAVKMYLTDCIPDTVSGDLQEQSSQAKGSWIRSLGRK